MMDLFERISCDASVMGGKACINGTRITVGMILMLISEGTSIDSILDEYPLLSVDDIAEALRYAAWAVGSREEMFVTA
ncbi:MAG: DUF433 domain-containing protein [Oscillospiraceae bacterium]|jgi:uncharacterized protein (DUF433 family)|nr:DUF433 domain-containing protein [Oscillospiraceae bacterium]